MKSKDLWKASVHDKTWNPVGVNGCLIDNELNKPDGWKTPCSISVCPERDLFAEGIKNKVIRNLWDIMWECNRHKFIIVSAKPENMKQFVRNWAFMKHFGWIDSERPPMTPGDIFDIDTLYYRDRCGHVIHSPKCNCNSNYVCAHPESEEECEHGLGLCYASSCPIASNRIHFDDMPEWERDDYSYDDENYVAEEPELMRLHSRPKYAYAENVYLGVSLEKIQNSISYL